MLVVSLLLAFIEPLYRLGDDAIVQAVARHRSVSLYRSTSKIVIRWLITVGSVIYSDVLLVSAGCSVRGI